MYVPLEVVAGFKMLRNLTTEVEVIKNALRGSTKVQLTEGPGGECLIRPTLNTASRVTIILRDIPKDVPEAEIRQLFSEEKVSHVRPDIGDTWFVTFATEDDCKAAYAKCQDKTFRDEPVKARIKSENLLKNFLPVQSPVEPQPASVFVPPAHPAAYAFGPPPVPMPYPYMMTGPVYRPAMCAPNDPFGMGHMQNPGYQPMGFVQPAPVAPEMANRPQPTAKGGKGGVGGKGYGYNGKGKGTVPPGGKGHGKDGGEHQLGPGRTAPKRGSQNAKGVTPPKLNQSDFPPLPSSSPQAANGYEGEFKRYQKEEIISILSTLANNSEGCKAPDLPENCACRAPEPIHELELCRNSTPEPAGQAASRPKTFAEAAISADDIKKPEKTRRGSSKKGTNPYAEERAQERDRNSFKGRGGGNRGSHRGSHHDRHKHDSKEETSKDDAPKGDAVSNGVGAAEPAKETSAPASESTAATDTAA
uniref:HTH La-type RNA-binding domain-containing protein n=1 Tax=Eutreptiella gymnastica TaxID=73025 RepID=A0A7S4LGJ5_9EUGL